MPITPNSLTYGFATPSFILVRHPRKWTNSRWRVRQRNLEWNQRLGVKSSNYKLNASGIV